MADLGAFESDQSIPIHNDDDDEILENEQKDFSLDDTNQETNTGENGSETWNLF